MANNHHPSNTFDFAEIAATDNGTNGVDGFVHFKNCYIKSSQWSAVYASKTVESFDLNFTNCVFKDVSNNKIDLNNPIFLEVTDYDNQVPRFGGLNFTDCAIIYDEDIPFFNLFENLPTSDGLGNITGNFFIVNLNDAGYFSGVNPENVNITYEYFPTIPLTEISLTTNQLNYLEEDKYIDFEITRNTNIEIPVAVEFEYTGSAEYGLDYDRSNGFTIIPSNSSFVMDAIEIIQDLTEEPSERLEMSAVENDCVQVGPTSVLEFVIDDMLTSTVEENIYENNEVKIFPNPTQEIVQIETKSTNCDITIYDNNGQAIRSFKNQFSKTTIDCSHFNPGIYFLKIDNKVNNTFTTHKIILK